jgi:hypothetical protein
MERRVGSTTKAPIRRGREFWVKTKARKTFNGYVHKIEEFCPGQCGPSAYTRASSKRHVITGSFALETKLGRAIVPARIPSR